MQPDSLIQPDTDIKNGDCFTYTDPMHGIVHYLQQRGDHVLHLNATSHLINQLDESYIRGTPDLIRVNPIVFAAAIRATIFALELNEFWKP